MKPGHKAKANMRAAFDPCIKLQATWTKTFKKLDLRLKRLYKSPAWLNHFPDKAHHVPHRPAMSTTQGGVIKALFVPPEIDFVELEARVLASFKPFIRTEPVRLAKTDPNMQWLSTKNEKLRSTAQYINEAVTPEQRQARKDLMFLDLYGTGRDVWHADAPMAPKDEGSDL
jgi:hypothetical protein